MELVVLSKSELDMMIKAISDLEVAHKTMFGQLKSVRLRLSQIQNPKPRYIEKFGARIREGEM